MFLCDPKRIGRYSHRLLLHLGGRQQEMERDYLSTKESPCRNGKQYQIPDIEAKMKYIERLNELNEKRKKQQRNELFTLFSIN